MLVRRCEPRGQSWVIDVRTGHGGDRSPTIWVFSCLVSLGIGSNSLCGPLDLCFVAISGVGDASVTGTLGIVQYRAGAGIFAATVLHRDTIYNGITIGDVAVSGMTAEEANNALLRLLDAGYGF